MKRWMMGFGFGVLVTILAMTGATVFSQREAPAPAPPPLQAPNQDVPVLDNVPTIPFESNTNFFKITPDQNFGEVLSIAVSSKGNIVVLNHPGTASSGPLYGNATTQLWEFDSNGKFIREIGKGVYGLGYATPFDSTSTTTCGLSTKARTPL